MATESNKKRVCIIGCGPSGMSALYHFNKLSNTYGSDIADVVCYEKKSDWGGLWNISWRKGVDEYGEHLNSSMYYDMWVNVPKEVFEYDDYTYEEHFGKLLPAYVTVPVIMDYMEGRFMKSSRDLRQFVKFCTVVNKVEFDRDTDDFTVRVKNLPTGVEVTERFTHVIVASGTFEYPNVPDVPGLDQFKGQILHSQDVKHMDPFKSKRILIIGARWSAEDLALQAFKYGSENVIISWRTMPHGQGWFDFPKGIEQRPQVEKVEQNTAYFKDGTKAEVDIIIFCTGYRWHFPFLAKELRVTEMFYCSRDFYKGILWLKGGNDKLLYIGAPYIIYSLPFFEAQAMWVWRYIAGDIQIPSREKMLADTDKWLEKLGAVKPGDFMAFVRFYTEELADICEASGYTKECTNALEIIHEWKEHKTKDILTYRDIQSRSVYTGKLTPLHHAPWMTAFEYSLDAFGVAPTTSSNQN